MAASYTQAIAWIVANDDTAWVFNNDPQSVTAALVADLFDKTDAKVKADLLAAAKKAGLNK